MVDSASPRVGVFMSFATDYLRRLFTGITDYAERHGPWNLFVDTLLDISARDLRRPKPPVDGLIVDLVSRPELRAVARDIGLPVVDVGPDESAPPFLGPRIWPDDHAAGRLAAEHLMERGFTRFGFVGLRGLPFSDRRREGFLKALATRRFEARLFERRQPQYGQGRFEREEGGLATFLRSLPQPAGLFVSQDMRARDVIYNARRIGIDMPRQLAIVSVDNDPMICNTLNPRLSSIPLDAHAAGRRAARVLDAMMKRAAKGKGFPRLSEHPPVLIPPRGVVARASSDTLAIADEDVAAAVRFIRENAARPITISDLLDAVPVSRRSLEMRFQKALGRSPQREIWRVRMDLARHYLAETDWSIKQIAAKSGFASPEWMSVAFRREMGITPTAHRRATRRGSAEPTVRSGVPE